MNIEFKRNLDRGFKPNLKFDVEDEIDDVRLNSIEPILISHSQYFETDTRARG